MSRREVRTGRSFAVPLFGIVMLLAFYLIVTDWNQLPELISTTLTNLHAFH